MRGALADAADRAVLGRIVPGPGLFGCRKLYQSDASRLPVAFDGLNLVPTRQVSAAILGHGSAGLAGILLIIVGIGDINAGDDINCHRSPPVLAVVSPCSSKTGPIV